MAHDGRDEELEALKNIPGIDPEKIVSQINKARGLKDSPDENLPVEQKKVQADRKQEEKSEEKKDELPDLEKIRADILNEMFGDQFANFEDFKKADIPGKLQELKMLREQYQNLENQVKTKPKHAFANDEIAKFNEFVRDTGINNFEIFNEIERTDIANMDDVDALALLYRIENPEYATDRARARKYIEKKYKVDRSKIESEDLMDEERLQAEEDYEMNLMEAKADARKAKARIQEFKSKIRMPELEEEAGKQTKKWTPEVEKIQKNQWSVVNDVLIKEFEKIPIPMKDAKDPIVNFVLPEETRKIIAKTAFDYAINNQMEVNEENVESIARSMYSDIILNNLPQIAHAIFERARSLTEKEALELFHNPSKSKNTDNASATQEMSSEAKRRAAFEAELKGL